MVISSYIHVSMIYLSLEVVKFFYSREHWLLYYVTLKYSEVKKYMTQFEFNARVDHYSIQSDIFTWII